MSKPLAQHAMADLQFRPNVGEQTQKNRILPKVGVAGKFARAVQNIVHANINEFATSSLGDCRTGFLS